MSKLLVDSMELGWLANNVYIISNIDTKECIIIDPAAKPEKIIDFIEEKKLLPKAILITHAHADHILALDHLRQKYEIKAYLAEKESDIISDSTKNAAKYLFRKDIKTYADILLKDNDLIHLLDVDIKVILTPGHTHGSVCYYIEEEKIIFTGDTLFKNSYGRHDLYSGNFEDLEKSLKEKLFVLPDDIIIYPGHMQTSTMGYEKKFNPILGDN